MTLDDLYKWHLAIQSIERKRAAQHDRAMRAARSRHG